MRADTLQAGPYVGTLSISSLVFFGMALTVWRTPVLQRRDDPMMVVPCRPPG